MAYVAVRPDIDIRPHLILFNWFATLLVSPVGLQPLKM